MLGSASNAGLPSVVFAAGEAPRRLKLAQIGTLFGSFRAEHRFDRNGRPGFRVRCGVFPPGFNAHLPNTFTLLWRHRGEPLLIPTRGQGVGLAGTMPAAGSGSHQAIPENPTKRVAE